jgi:hypothetical protein
MAYSAWFPTAAAVICALVFVFLPLVDKGGVFWGLGHAALVPLWLRVLLGLVPVAATLPRTGDLLAGWLAPAARRAEGLFRRFPGPAWAGAGIGSAAVFWMLRDRNLALGDSEHLIKAVTWYVHFEGWHLTFDEALELLLHSAVYRLFLAAGFPGAAETAFALTSVLAGGFFVTVLLLLVRQLGGTALQRLALLALALSGGYVQLFFGHVENYTMVAFLMLLYLYLGVRFLREPGRGLFPPAALLSVAVSFHLLAGWLYPSLLWLWWTGRGRRDQSGKRSDGGLTALFAGVVLPLAAAFGLCRLAGFGSERFGETHLAAMKFVFLLGPEYEHFQYGFLSPAHLLDALNQLWLAALPAIFALLYAVLHRGGGEQQRRPGGEAGFALTAAIALQCFALCWNPDLGALKDWDLFAAAGLGWTFAALVLLSRRGVPARPILVFAICGLLFTVPWVVGNHLEAGEVDPGLARLTTVDRGGTVHETFAPDRRWSSRARERY